MKTRTVLLMLLLPLFGFVAIAPAAPDMTDSDKATAIAAKVAEGIEALKKKYPDRLKGFTAEKCVTRVKEIEGFAPGTASNPELASISFHNGVLGQKVPGKKAGKGKQQVETIYDKRTGVRIAVYFFKGRARGNDMRPAEKFGDLSVHIYAEGPAGKQIRADILKILEKQKKKQP